MKKIVLFISVVLFLASCSEKDVSLYPSFKESTTIIVNEKGSFSEDGLISAATIKSAIDDLELDETGSIESVSVEGIYMVIEKLSDNTAESVNLDVSIRSLLDGDKYIIEEYEIDIPNEKTTINLPNYLNKEGVFEVKDQLSAIILNGATNDIHFDTEGTAIPEGSVVNVKIEIYVKGSVVFTQTIEFI